MIRKIVICVGFFFFSVGCGEELVPANKPTVTQAQALCRSVGTGNVNKLHSVTVRVQDLDGQADLVTAIAIVEASSIEMEKISIPTEMPLGGCKDPDGICEVEFRWSRRPDQPQIYCGENGNALQIEFEVADAAGFKERIFISTSLQEN